MILDVVLLRMSELCEEAGGASRCLVSRARVDEANVTIAAELDCRKQGDRILAGA